MHHYVIMSCLLLETVGTLASILKSTFSEVLLIKCLFRVLEKLGDQHGLVQDASLKTLELLAASLNLANVAELVSQNADYIVDDICYRMQDLNLYPDTPKILGVLLQHSELYSKASSGMDGTDREKSGYESMIGLIRDTLSSIFEGMDNHLHASQSNATILVTFFSMLRSISRLLIARRKKRDTRIEAARDLSEDVEASSDDDIPSTRSIDDIEAYFRRVHAKKDELLDISPLPEKEAATGNGTSTQASQNVGSKVPHLSSDDDAKNELALIKDIILRCQHFAQVNDLRVQNQVVDLFLESCEYFIHDDSLDSELLPLIHSFWPSILRYIVEDISPVIQEKSLDVVGKLVPRSNIGEFLYGRIIDDVWPSLFKKMTQRLNPKEYIRKFEERFPVVARSATEITEEVLNQVYEGEESRLEYKIRRRALGFIRDILSTPVFRQRLAAVPNPQNTKATLSHRTIIHVSLPYLDERQPKELQDCAVTTLRALMSISPDPLWYFLNEILAQEEQLPLSSQEHDVASVEIGPTGNRFGFFANFRHFKHNALILLEEIEENDSTQAT
uniref:TTI1 C-terminal TPR domain-containing protein n=1 Tax=Percolomonas cosmopolitus TaxID=63605 RepID=A0A7S1PF21_9EUKA